MIYLDPPYEGTAKYQHNICHKELLEFINKQECSVYLSSYEFEGMKEVASFEHRCTLSATANNEVTEKLFTKAKHETQNLP